MGDYRASLNDHYGQTDLCGRIRQACERLGFTPEEMTRDDLANLDEIHIRGLEATRELGRQAGLKAGQRILDVGAGLGGPARTLAAEFGCQVVGLEIVAEFCRAATLLTEWVGLTDQVSFQEGDMRAMPFAGGEFDAVVTQHTIMNVEEKAALFTEIRRVLKPAGGFLLYEVCGEDGHALHYPVPWAGGPEISFLINAEELRKMITAAGFTENHWSDVTAKALDWFDGLASGMQAAAPRPRGPNVGVVLGPDAAEKSRNLQRNLREGRIQVVQGLFTC
ncbi:MAG: class I SAM-dependent methyltransferase [Candidatus Krumholzibacteriota bacterium]